VVGGIFIWHSFAATPRATSADLNGDGKVDISDLSVLLSNFGKSGSGIKGDLNADAKVNLSDLSVLLSQFGGGGNPSPTPTPPPSGNPPIALVYDNPPFADTDNATTLGSVLERTNQKFKVVYVGGKHGPLTAAQLATASLFAFPGGDVDTDTAKTDFAKEIPLVNDFVKNGGHYLGVCAGGFVAGKEGFGVFPGDVGDFPESPGAEVTDDK